MKIKTFLAITGSNFIRCSWAIYFNMCLGVIRFVCAPNSGPYLALLGFATEQCVWLWHDLNQFAAKLTHSDSPVLSCSKFERFGGQQAAVCQWRMAFYSEWLMGSCLVSTFLLCWKNRRATVVQHMVSLQGQGGTWVSGGLRNSCTFPSHPPEFGMPQQHMTNNQYEEWPHT